MALWWWAALGRNEYVLPSPLATLRVLGELLTSGRFWSALALTLLRALAGWCIAVLVGSMVGSLMGAREWLAAVLDPLVHFLLSTPAVVFVIIAMVWFGASSSTVVAVVALAASPMMLKTTCQAVRSIDNQLMEMLTVCGMTRWQRIVHGAIPMVTPACGAAAVVALGQSLRVTVMAELLTTASGVGGELRLAQINIETPEVFAYAIILSALSLGLGALFPTARQQPA